MSGQESVAVLALVMVTFVSAMSSTVVTNALPVILGALGGTTTQFTWVITITLLTSTATTPIWGKLSDLVSKKMLLQVSTAVFVAASVLSGLSTSAAWLIVWRGLLGVGLGGVQALALIALAALVPARQRGRYGGWFGAAGAVAIVSGPLVGGLVVDTLGWRAVFYVGLPFALVAVVLLQRTLHLPVVRRPVRIDFAGSLLILGGVSLLLVWASFAGKSFGWVSGTSALLAVSGAVLLTAAVVVESRVQEPVVPLSMLTRRTPVLAIVASLGAGIAMFGSAVFFGQYYQVARGFTPTHSGLLVVPMMGGLFVASLVSGRLITSTGRWRRYLVLGGALLVFGFTLLAFVTHATPLPYVVVATTVVGLGVGLTQQNLVLAVQNSVAPDEVGTATSVTTFFRSLGGTVGIALLGALLAAQVSSRTQAGLAAIGAPPGETGGGSLALAHLPAPVVAVVRAAYGDGMGRVFLVGAVMSVVSLVAILLIREVPLRTTLGPESDEEMMAAVSGAPTVAAEEVAPGAA